MSWGGGVGNTLYYTIKTYTGLYIFESFLNGMHIISMYSAAEHLINSPPYPIAALNGQGILE